jgi:hypothetical protein
VPDAAPAPVYSMDVLIRSPTARCAWRAGP